MNHGWKHLDAGDYRAMRERHAELWEVARRWVAYWGFQSLIEIGGGDGYAASFLPVGGRYLNVDVNADAAPQPGEVIREDWATLDKAPLNGRFDAALCLGTFEHIADPTAALDDIFGLGVRGAFISFWRRLDWPTLVLRANCGINPNDIPRAFIEDWCRANGLDYRILRVERKAGPSDDVLIWETPCESPA